VTAKEKGDAGESGSGAKKQRLAAVAERGERGSGAKECGFTGSGKKIMRMVVGRATFLVVAAARSGSRYTSGF